MIMLAGCTTRAAVPTEGASGAFCQLDALITFSDHDTKETIRQIDRHNARFVCVCHNDCPAP